MTIGSAVNSTGAGAGGRYARFWRWHFLAAVIVVPFVLWQSVTGTLYLWSEWWMDRAHPQLRFVKSAPQSVPLSAQIGAALAAVPETQSHVSAGVQVSAEAPLHHGSPHHVPTSSSGLTVQGILAPQDPGRSTAVLLQDAGGVPFPVFVDPHTGQVLGRLAAAQWLPGWTRALHGGWPLGKPGSWLLEIGDGWAILSILTGLYLWWPRGRGLFAGLWPRVSQGTRIALRDLHACVAVWFSLVFLFFLISALPWTAFWGEVLLPRVESASGQLSPAGFSHGGASPAQVRASLHAIDALIAEARARNVRGTLDIRLAPWPDAPLFVTNRNVWPEDDRMLMGNSRGGAVTGDFRNADLPVVPRLVALGVHVHQGDFGAANVWLNTLFAAALIWLSATGLTSWWIRRPQRGLGIPPRVDRPITRGLKLSGLCLCLLLPLFGLSVLVLWLLDRCALAWSSSTNR